MGAARIPLIMTRPEGSNERFIGQMPHELRSQFQIVISPLIEIVPLQEAPDMEPQDAVVFTSANGVRFAPVGQGREAYCVGDATTRVAAEKGWRSRCFGETSDALVTKMIANRPKGALWHLSGLHTRGKIAERLSAAGLNIKRVALYDQKRVLLSGEAINFLSVEQPSIVPIFSPRSAMQFVQSCPKDAAPYLLALSDAIAEPLRALRCLKLEISRVPNGQSMVESIEKIARCIRLG